MTVSIHPPSPEMNTRLPSGLAPEADDRLTVAAAGVRAPCPRRTTLDLLNTRPSPSS
jgi:hypothetical protein